MIEYIPIISLVIAMVIILPFAIWLEKRGRDKKRSLIVPDQRRWFGLFMVLLLVVGCDNHSTEPDTIAGAESSKIAFPAFPNFPALPKPPGGTVTVTVTESQTSTDIPVSSGTTEILSYSGRYNGDRPTWYGKKKLSEYPATITIDITGCFSRTITHNGKRYESAGLIVKQSDVSGRGMAVVAPSSCQSKTASVRY